MREPLFLGIDGGGTRCRARICDVNGKTLGEGVGGPANVRLGLERAFSEIESACQRALTAAGLGIDAVGRLNAGLGLAGLMLQSDRDVLRNYPHPFASMLVESDAYIACLGAHGGRDGAILILGTGSCGCALVNGQAFTIGGWGFHLSDQGSGAALGQAAIRNALWAFEKVIHPTALTNAIMEQFGGDLEQVLLWGERANPRDFAAIAPLVFEHARGGDPLALELIEDAARAASSLIRALHARDADHVALLGGLAVPLAGYLSEDVRAVLTQPEGDALDGALRMIRDRTPGDHS